jgi:GntR family transcriptional regulator, transcriptional repressor for pyruvate dehydrogenase complex
MRPIKKVRLSESVIQAIKEMIIEDKFQPGDKFYSENELTKKLEVSRASIREAIRILEVTGQLIVRQGKGVFILDTNAKNFQPFVNWLKTNEQAILDHFEVRLIIEPKVAVVAAKNADADDIQQMEEACSEFEAHVENKNTADIIRWDRNFHRRLAQATKNLTLAVLMKSMTISLPDGWISSLHTPGRIKKTIQEHRTILEAVKNRKKDAAEQAMTYHLERALHDIRLHMNGKL